MKRLMESFNVSNLIWIIGLVFASGVVYSEFKTLHQQVNTLEQRLEKKIIIINELEAEINGIKSGFIDRDVLNQKLNRADEVEEELNEFKLELAKDGIYK